MERHTASARLQDSGGV